MHPILLFKYTIKVDGELGEGSFGFVLHGQRKSDGLEVAIKVILRTESSSDWPVHSKHGRVPNDVMVMETLDHDNIIRMLDVLTDDKYVYVVSLAVCGGR